MDEHKPKRSLSNSDLEAIYKVVPEKEWPHGKLGLVWNKCIPPDADFDDFLYFLYSCQARSLDPLLGEAYLRMQFESGGRKPIIICGIGGMLKNANRDGLLDGVKVEFEENEAGVLISCTGRVWRKGCAHPFESRVFYHEYVQTTKEGKPNRMWGTKPHIMIQKVAIASALRLAFATELAGVYVAEEFAPQPNEPDSNFIVEEKAEEKVTSDIRRETPPPPSKENKPESLRDQLLAKKQRLLKDLSVPRAQSKAVLDAYFQGFLGLEEGASLPKDPASYIQALDMLDLMALVDPQPTKEKLGYKPYDLGREACRIITEWCRHGLWPWEVSALGFRVAASFGLESSVDLLEYLKANGVDQNQPADVQAFFRLALVDRELAKDASIRADAAQIGVAFVLDGLEEQLGGHVETFDLKTIRAAFEKGILVK